MTSIAVPLFSAVAVFCGAAAVDAAGRIEREFLSAIIFGGYGLAFGLAPAVVYWDGGPGVMGASVAAFLGAVGLIVGRTIARRAVGAPQPLNEWILFGEHRWRVGAGCAVVGLGGLLMFMYGSAGSIPSYLASGRFEFRLNPHSSIMSLAGLYLIPFVGVPALMLAAARSRTFQVAGIVGGVLGAMLVFYLLKGTRSIPIGLLLGLGVMALMRAAVMRSGAGQRSFRPGAAIGIVGIAVAVSLVLPNLYQARTTLSDGEFDPVRALTGRSGSMEPRGSEGIFHQEPLNYAEFLVDVVQLYPRNHDFLWLYPLRRIAFFPLSSGGLKPGDTNRIIASALGRGANETTIPPSMPGEGYVVAGGYPGVFPWLVLYGFLLGLVEASLHRRTVALTVLGMGFGTSLLALRGQLYEIVLVAAVSLLVAEMVLRLTGNRQAWRWAADREF